MARRQAHGRPLLKEPKKRRSVSTKKANTAAQSTAQDAFAIAANEIDERGPKTPRFRQLDVEEEFPNKRRKHAVDEDDEEDNVEQERLRRKRPRNDDEEFHDADSDSDGLEWRVGVDEDDDSEIESEDAFGASDDEELKVTAKAKKRGAAMDSEEEEEPYDPEDEDDMSSLGSDAVDLATALDQWEESESEEGTEGPQTGKGEHFSAFEDEDGSTNPSSGDEQYDDEDADPEKFDQLRSLIRKMQDDEEEDDGVAKKTKISLKDLGLFGTKDPNIKKSLKLMSKERKAELQGKTSAAKKLDVPLPRRQQDKLDRSAAYDKTNQTLERWTATVKHNRRAEHLVFPLAQNEPTQGLDKGGISTIDTHTAENELEKTIMSIMEESGLGPSAPRETQALNNVAMLKPPLAVTKARNAELRRQRELRSRQEAKAKRIRKIKSKAYHRVHKKSEKRKQMKELEALEAAAEEDGIPLPEEDIDELNHQRAMSRMGGKHKNSKWAKSGARAGRGVWDDNYKTGMRDISQREADLRRRVEGKGAEVDGEEDEEEESDSDSDRDEGDERARLLREIDALENAKPDPMSRLMQQPFMQRAEAKRKAENDEALKQLRKELSGVEVEAEESDAESVDIGRRKYGPSQNGVKRNPLGSDDEDGDDKEVANKKKLPSLKWNGTPGIIPRADDSDDGDQQGNTNPWEHINRSDKKAAKAKPAMIQALDTSSQLLIAESTEKVAGTLKQRLKASASAAASKSNANNGAGATGADGQTGLQVDDDTSSSDSSDEESLADDTHETTSTFKAEKQALIEEQGDKIVDDTLPGWGSWVGGGISKRDAERNKGRFLRKVEGVVKEKKRKDRGKEKVIINEKVATQTTKYLATQLPHPFETKEQYERSLQMPIGKEWVASKSFQQGTKPRVIVKQGVIAPMSKPMYL